MKKTIATAVLVVFTLLFGFFAISNQVTLQTTEYKQEQVQEVQEADSLTTFRQAVRLNSTALLSSDNDDAGDSAIEESNNEEQEEPKVELEKINYTLALATGKVAMQDYELDADEVNKNIRLIEVDGIYEIVGEYGTCEDLSKFSAEGIDHAAILVMTFENAPENLMLNDVVLGNDYGKNDNFDAENTLYVFYWQGQAEKVRTFTAEGYEELIVTMKQHEHTLTTVEAVEVTCIENGHNGYEVCEVCSEKIGYEEIEALGHTFTEYEVITEATCTKAGERKHTCTVCDFEEVEVIEALGHGELDEDGYCTRCGGKDVEYTFAEFVFAKIGLGKFYADYAMWISIVSIAMFAILAFATGYVIGHKYEKKTKTPKQKKEKLTKREKAQRDYRAPAARRGGNDNNGPRVHF